MVTNILTPSNGVLLSPSMWAADRVVQVLEVYRPVLLGNLTLATTNVGGKSLRREGKRKNVRQRNGQGKRKRSKEKEKDFSPLTSLLLWFLPPPVIEALETSHT